MSESDRGIATLREYVLRKRQHTCRVGVTDLDCSCEIGKALDHLTIRLVEAEKVIVARNRDHVALNDRLVTAEKALGDIGEIQPRVLSYIRANGFKWECRESLGSEPGNWQHLAFSIYSDLCKADTIARSALTQEEK